MKRTTPLRRTPLARAPMARKRTPKPARRLRSTMPDADTTAQLIARAQGRCEICNLDLSTGRDWSRHHRLPRGRGGKNTLANLMLLCGSGTTGCHGTIESHRAIAYSLGWLVRTGLDPADVAVEIFAPVARRTVLLTNDGRYAEGR